MWTVKKWVWIVRVDMDSKRVGVDNEIMDMNSEIVGVDCGRVGVDSEIVGVNWESGPGP